MPDYKEMYTILFNEATKAITILQQAQQKAEEIYCDTSDDLPLIQPDESANRA